MKRYFPLLVLLCCLAACARIVPRTAEAARILPEAESEATEPAEALSPEAADELRGLLSEAAAHSGEGETAGSSLRLFALAARLLDWQAANALPPAFPAEFAAALTGAERDALVARLSTLRSAALALCRGNTGAMEDGGYIPHGLPWEEAAAAAFFDALIRGMKSEYSEKRSGKMNIFPLFPLQEAEKFDMMQES